MARILAISSRVAHGHVGLSIIVPALQALGHDVIELPTVMLSNHPGHAHVAGTPVDPAVLARMLDALDANGWLADIDAVLTGYLPSVDHVMFATAAVQLVAQRRWPQPVIYLCDPVLGDDPKGLYIDRAAAEALRDVLISSADLATPNRFELSFLTGRDISGPSDVVGHGLGCKTLFATSIPSQYTNEVANVATSSPDLQTQAQTVITRVPLRPNAPHGTGDLFSALVLSAWLATGYRQTPIQISSIEQVLSAATAGVDAVLAASRGRGELSLSALPRCGQPPLTWPIETLADATRETATSSQNP